MVRASRKGNLHRHNAVQLCFKQKGHSVRVALLRVLLRNWVSFRVPDKPLRAHKQAPIELFAERYGLLATVEPRVTYPNVRLFCLVTRSPN